MRNKEEIVWLATGLLVLAGCSTGERSWRAAYPIAGMGAGAAAANAASSDPWVVAGGTAAGGVIGWGLGEWQERREEDHFVTGYEQGLSDSVKRQYWIQAQLQRWAGEQMDEGRSEP